MAKFNKTYCPYCGRQQKTIGRGRKICAHCGFTYTVEGLEADKKPKKRKRGERFCIYCGEPQRISLKARIINKCSCKNCGNSFWILGKN